MASVTEGVIPRSKLKQYAVDDLGLIGEEVELFISIMRAVEGRSSSRLSVPEPDQSDGKTLTKADEAKSILKRLAPKKDQPARRLPSRTRFLK